MQIGHMNSSMRDSRASQLALDVLVDWPTFCSRSCCWVYLYIVPVVATCGFLCVSEREI